MRKQLPKMFNRWMSKYKYIYKMDESKSMKNFHRKRAKLVVFRFVI